MNEEYARVNLLVRIIPDNVDPSDLVDFDPELDGKHFSTIDEIKANKTSDGYSVLYLASTIAMMDTGSFADSLVKLFISNIKDAVIDTYIIYNCKLKTGEILFLKEAGMAVINLSSALMQKNPVTDRFNYVVTENVKAVANELKIIYTQSMEEETEEDDDYMDPYDSIAALSGAMKEFSKNGKRKRKKNAKYGKSHIIRSSKNPKKMYKRHGIIVCKNKKAIKRDESIIKDFLRDFIPGKSAWKKEFRKELTKRWMQMYMLTPKQLKILQKHHDKSRDKRRSSINTERTLELTRRLFSGSTDIWNDPTR